jgi:hypothetical protein
MLKKNRMWEKSLQKSFKVCDGSKWMQFFSNQREVPIWKNVTSILSSIYLFGLGGIFFCFGNLYEHRILYSLSLFSLSFSPLSLQIWKHYSLSLSLSIYSTFIPICFDAWPNLIPFNLCCTRDQHRAESRMQGSYPAALWGSQWR